MGKKQAVLEIACDAPSTQRVMQVVLADVLLEPILAGCVYNASSPKNPSPSNTTTTAINPPEARMNRVAYEPSIGNTVIGTD